MNTRLNRPFLPFACITSLLLVMASAGRSQDPVADPANDPALALLRNSDMEVRIEALRKLQTSLDPRIPEAFLPLLSDEGDSIRRLAARGVGSRWHQIPAARTAAFLAALRPLVAGKEDHPDVANMADRATGLLTRRHEGPMFSASPDGKWVVYERFGLPCLLDLGRGNEELIGWSGNDREGWFAPAWSNGEVASAAIWEPQSRVVALDMILSRKVSSLWFWVAEGSSEVRLDPEAIAVPFLPPGARIEFAGGFFTTPRRWFSEEFQFEVFFSTVDPATQEFTDHEAMAGWNFRTGVIRELPEGERPAPAP